MCGTSTLAPTPEIIGRKSDGTERKLAVATQRSDNEAIKLVWAGDRIASLFASERPAEAIALARKHNLLCEGVSFIAWDEAEQVAIARHGIVQPSLQPFDQMLDCAYPTAAHSQVANFYGAMADDGIGEECYPLHSLNRQRSNQSSRPPTPIEIQRILPQLREFLRAAGATEKIVERYVEWAGTQASLADCRCLVLPTLHVTEARGHSDPPKVRAVFELGLKRALANSPEAFLQWAEAALPARQLLLEILEALGAAMTPIQVIEDVRQWALEAGDFDHTRLAELEPHSKKLRDAPFSAAYKHAIWQALLSLTQERNPGATAPAPGESAALLGTPVQQSDLGRPHPEKADIT